MKALKTVQVLAKLGRIFSKIIFVFCIVGFCLCVVGLIGLAVGGQALKFGGVTLHSILKNEANLSTGTLYASVIGGAILCAGEAVLCRFSVHYFTRELADGTPFTEGGARELQRLGILAICIPIGTQILASIAHGIVSAALGDVAALHGVGGGSVSIGVMMLVTAQICKYGASLEGARSAAADRKELTE